MSQVVELRGLYWRLCRELRPWETDNGTYMYCWPFPLKRSGKSFPPFHQQCAYKLTAKKGSSNESFARAISRMGDTDVWLLTRLCLAKHRIASWRRAVLSATSTRQMMAAMRDIVGMWESIRACFARAVRVWSDCELPAPVYDFFRLCAEELRSFTAIFFP